MMLSQPVLALGLVVVAAAQDGDQAFFERQVLPLLERRCFECHGPGPRVKAGLRLTSAERLARGGQSGPVIDLERPAASLLLEMLSYDDERHRMPPEGKLPEQELAVLTRWVEGGGAWSSKIRIEVEQEQAEGRLTQGDGREGWSYAPLVRPAVPQARDTTWGTNPIDAFLLARLEAAGLTPAPPADQRALLRRVTYDLTGLPPSPDEMTAFLSDGSPDAWDRVIERLLASPHYGERWGRHWLDLVRFAETNGYERDSDKPHIWRYRDYVIDAFNRDLPYDRFVLEQLAGDELDDASPESIVATGFSRLMLWDDEPGNGRLQARYDVLDDLVRVTGESFLGMTIGCARCHDHKGDEISQVDYYSFMAFFEDLEDIRSAGTLVDVSSAAEQQAQARARAEHEAARDQVSRELNAIEQVYRRRAPTGGAASGLADLRYRFYRDTWSKLPDFDALLHEDEGTLDGGLFDLSPATREEAFGFVFEGRLTVPVSGEYRFTLDSDDGSRLTVDGALVVERDGTHGLGDPQVGSVRLEAGSVPVRLDFFQWVGGAALDLVWERVDDDLWRYTFEPPGADWAKPAFDASAWPAGRGGFGAAGTPGAQVGTEWRTPSIWLRRDFEWDADDAADLALVLHHDEEVEVFLNGVPAFRRGGFRKDYTLVEVGDEARATVRRGRNVIALRCTNSGGGQYVHARPVHRADLLGNPLPDLAFGRRALSASPRSGAQRDTAKEIEASGERYLSREELDHWRALRQELRDLQRKGPPRPEKLAFAATSRGPHPPQMYVHLRGSVHVPGPAVEPALPTCLGLLSAPLPDPPQGAASPGRRRALAESIASADNPLTARVMVNRIWQHHFGRGIVASSSDFGEFGERPTHPGLLDWLASEFVAQGWSVKQMHRLILRSSAYRMGHRPPDERAAQVDPANDLLWSYRMRRLSAEEVRDSILWLTGKLNSSMGGPSFFSMISPDALATSSKPNEVWGTSPEEQRLRRSVYIKVKRSMQTPLLAAFDLADTDNPCPERFTTIQPAQALSLLNGDFVQLRAGDVAARLEQELPGDPRAQIERLLVLALGRPARADEVREILELRAELLADFGQDEHRAMANCCLLVINLNEFAFIE